jgi:uncharacterized protein (DUF342 family)
MELEIFDRLIASQPFIIVCLVILIYFMRKDYRETIKSLKTDLKTKEDRLSDIQLKSIETLNKIEAALTNVIQNNMETQLNNKKNELAINNLAERLEKSFDGVNDKLEKLNQLLSKE